MVTFAAAGEHGDSEVALWSGARIGGAPLRSWLTAAGRYEALLPGVLDRVRGAAGRIIRSGGAR